MTTASYQPKNEETTYLNEFYYTLDEIKNNFYDALIITGAPVETLPFEEVAYWEELVKIIDQLGRETKINSNSPMFYIYNDGTTEKKIIID